MIFPTDASALFTEKLQRVAYFYNGSIRPISDEYQQQGELNNG